MKKTIVIALGVLFVLTSLSAVAFAKKTENKYESYQFTQDPHRNVDISDLPPEVQQAARPRLSSAAVDTFHLAWYSFDVNGQANAQGWTTQDLTDQLEIFWHVASGLGELNGGDFGNLLPLDGVQSMWMGKAPDAAVPYCGWVDLPGYGNNWTQILDNEQPGDSVCISYKVFWDSEPGYDGTQLQYFDEASATWVALPVGQGNTARPLFYDAGPTTLVETFKQGTLGQNASMKLRFVFQADGAWSDEDGLWDTDGAILVDSITVETFTAGVLTQTSFTDFESATEGDNQDVAGNWVGREPIPFGNFGALYSGITLLQEDPCFLLITNAWAWFDNPAITNYACHTPAPAPQQGAMRFGGPNTTNGSVLNPDELYMNNEIWSPLIPNVGAGEVYQLQFLTYRDLPLDNLQFYIWSARSWTAGCPTLWGNDNFVFFGGQRDFIRSLFNISTRVESTSDFVQISVGAIDQCGVWCGIFGTGTCHSHAPIIDEVHLVRIDLVGPQYVVRFIDLFQDNFEGTTTGGLPLQTAGFARFDGAIDIAPGDSPTIYPADSSAVTITNLGTDPNTGTGPSAYMYVAVWPSQNPPGTPGRAITGTDILAPEQRNGADRWPLVGSTVVGGTTWYCFRMDSVVNTAGAITADRYCADLRDDFFIAGDTICYFYCADDGLGNENYWSRRLNGQGAAFITQVLAEAAASPCEVTILPAAGAARGGDILYVDDTDDRGGPVQLFFDTAFRQIPSPIFPGATLEDEIDRYDVQGPSSSVANSLAARVKDTQSQIVNNYRKIIWSSGNLNTSLVGDGGPPDDMGGAGANGGNGPEKSRDYQLLHFFMDQGTNNPGLWLTGDNIGWEWRGTDPPSPLLGGNALFNDYMTFAILGDDHVALGEPISPVLTGTTGGCFDGLSFYAYGGCAVINSFDVFGSTGSTNAELVSSSGAVYSVSQTTANNGGSTARVLLDGFSFHYIRDIAAGGTVPARTLYLVAVLEWLVNNPSAPTGIGDTPKQLANNQLDNNFPNPFNPTTTIRYSIKEQGAVSLKIYNAAGQLVRTLVNDVQTPQASGFNVTWDGKNDSGQTVSSGVYFYKLVANNFVDTKKMVLLK